MSSSAYLVPHDFTVVGDIALQQAITMSEKTGAGIYLLHVVKKESEAAEAKQQLIEVINKFRPKGSAIKFFALVETGNIFKDISSAAKKIRANVIIMGTHGIVGVQQKMFGSFAAKVIQSTEIPFLIVQDELTAHDFKKIVMPVDVKVQSIQVLSVALEIAKQFDAEMHILGINSKDRIFHQKIQNNILVVKKQLQKYGVRGKVVQFPDTGGFTEKVLEYAKEKDADAFAIAYNSGDGIVPRLDKFAQSILMNEMKLPVAIINSNNTSKGYF